MDFQKLLHLRIFMKTYTPIQYLVVCMYVRHLFSVNLLQDMEIDTGNSAETTDTLSEGLYAFLYSLQANFLNIYWTGNILGINCRE
jgi:hypothetical protein